MQPEQADANARHSGIPLDSGVMPTVPGLVSATIWAVGWFAIARFHPWSMIADIPTSTSFESAEADVFWETLSTAIECVLLQGIALAIWRIRLRSRPSSSPWTGRLLLSALPLFFCVNLWLFTLTGIHVLSARSVALLQNVPAGIVGFTTPGVGLTIAGLGLAWSAVFAIAYASERVACLGGPHWIGRSFVPRPSDRWAARFAYGSVILSFVVLLACLVAPSFWRSCVELVQRQPARHPVVALGLMRRDAFTELPEIDSENSDSKRLTEQIAALPESTKARIQQMRMNVVVNARDDEKTLTNTIQTPDVLLIIGESLRPELLTQDVMPNAFALTREGTWLRQHYSGGNSSSLGVFSIVSGLEAVWFYKSDVRFAPAMNRLFWQAGYELGFFASTNDWATFQMEAFLSDRHYDVFQSKDFTGLDADQRAISAAEQFLESSYPRPPRLAVLCLYGTHAPFWSDNQFATDQPAASESYPIPFAKSWRSRVWNRYRNAARTLDASIAELLEPALRHETKGSTRSRIVLLTGDHGESFGEDGTIGHGTQISVAQTQTLAVLAGPSIPHAEWDRPSHHSDWLPTLLSAAGISTSRPDQFDGRDLTNLPDVRPATPFSIAGYVGKEIAIIGPPNARTSLDPATERHPVTSQSPVAWALKCQFSLMDYRAKAQYAIRTDGTPVIIGTQPESRVLEDWLAVFRRE